MKTPVQMMLTAFMDDLKDAQMLIDYAMEACSSDYMDVYNYFKNKARSRVEQMKSDYDYIYAMAGMKDRLSNGDEIAIALDDYLSYSVTDLMGKVSKMR